MVDDLALLREVHQFQFQRFLSISQSQSFWREKVNPSSDQKKIETPVAGARHIPFQNSPSNIPASLRAPSTAWEARSERALQRCGADDTRVQQSRFRSLSHVTRQRERCRRLRLGATNAADIKAAQPGEHRRLPLVAQRGQCAHHVVEGHAGDNDGFYGGEKAG